MNKQESNETETEKIPKEWRILKIGNILSLEYGEGLVARHRKGDKYPVYGSNGIIGYNSEYLIKGPGIIVGRKGTIGAIRWSEDDFWPIDTTYYIKLKETEIDLKWLSNKLLTLGLSKLNMATGTPGLNRDLVYKLNISIPPLPEQKKIAEIFLTTDQAIEEMDENITKTARLKKGLMQELLTKGIGHKKFKETEIGKIPEEWQIIRLKDLANILRGASPRPIDDKRWFSENSRIGWVRISDVTAANKYLNKTKQYFSEDGINKSRFVKKGNLIMSICATLGKPILLELDVCIHDGFIVFEDLKKQKINIEFLYYLLKNNEKIFKCKGQIGTQANLNTNIVGLTKILLPPLFEQNKIAEILSTVDERIQLLKEKKNKLERVKKGLMNDLLTGRKRVKVEA